MDRHDVGMLECGEQLDLAQEARACDRVGRELLADELERDEPIRDQLARPVDGAHAAPADDRLDAVAGEGAAWRKKSLHPRSKSIAAQGGRGRSPGVWHQSGIGPDHASNRRKTATAFCPPKPKPLMIAVSTRALRLTLGT